MEGFGQRYTLVVSGTNPSRSQRPPRRPRRLQVLTVTVGVVGTLLAAFFIYGIALTPTGAPFSNMRNNLSPNWTAISAAAGTTVTLADGRQFELLERLPSGRAATAATVEQFDWAAYADTAIQDDGTVELTVYQGWLRCGNGGSTWNPFAKKRDTYARRGVYTAEPPDPVR